MTQDPSSEDVRAAYTGALQVFAYEGHLAWRMIGTFVTFNALLLALATYSAQARGRFLDVLAVLLFVAGIIGTVLWASMVLRSRRYHDYWLRSARELEAHLDPRVQTLQRGEQFRLGRTVNVVGEEMVLPWFAQLRMSHALFFMFGLFMLGYVGVFVAVLLRLAFSLLCPRTA